MEEKSVRKHYKDPTSDAAVGNIMRETKRKKPQTKKRKGGRQPWKKQR